jgi:aryl-alcohol dehydrogenase
MPVTVDDDPQPSLASAEAVTTGTLRVTAAVVEQAGGPFQLSQLDLDTRLGALDVLVEIVAVGLCQTDVHVRDQELPVPLPVVLGHEGAGIVRQVGDAVVAVRPGDHVALSYQSCGHCAQCLTGAPMYCDHVFALNFGGARADGTTALHRDTASGRQDIHGHFFGQSSFATYAVATERNVVKVDDDMPLELAGPLGCGMQTGAGAVLNSLRVPAGASIAVFGTGAVGLAAVMAARAAGARRIIAVDINPGRLALAAELGATDTVNGAQEDTGERIAAITGTGADYVVEVTGRPEMLHLAVEVLGPLGVAAQVGGPPAGTEASIDMNALLTGGRSIRGVHQGDSIPQRFIPQLIDLYRSGGFPFDRLVRFYDFEQINDAVADTRSGATIKPILRIGK